MTERKIKKRRTQPWYEIVLKTCESLSEDWVEAKSQLRQDHDSDGPEQIALNMKARDIAALTDRVLATSLAPLLDDYSVPADKFAMLVNRVEALKGGPETKKSVKAIIELYTTVG